MKRVALVVMALALLGGSAPPSLPAAPATSREGLQWDGAHCDLLGKMQDALRLRGEDGRRWEIGYIGKDSGMGYTYANGIRWEVYAQCANQGV